MCVVCGCSGEHPEGRTAAAAPNGDLDFGANAARVSVPGLSAERAIKLEADVLGANDRVAARNRAHFVAHGVTALNLVSSPGSGKTTLLCATIAALRRRAPGVEVAVIEGDQQTSNDADRIRATGAPAVQVNTGKGCHLDAPMVAAAFERLPLHHHHDHHDHHEHGHHHHDDDHGHAHAERLLFIENVGNLVCPALWDLGEAAKVAILSVTEGEDKPLKYPDMFAAARLMVLNKIDLLPHLDFDVQRCIEYARRVNPAIEVLQVSARSGEGLDAWLSWLLHLAPQPALPAAADGETALKERIAALEAQVRALGGQPG
ncbi:hydrogenase nickel incorporation protein HypB [Rubrivivax gelatinosus]|uniref:Hydrogenase maturation factor HypB n=1 Tax=Rubrivivax gelatinosus TaxID=28068 RepID=A0A4R2LX46_RUBGE|nr:hydrogenase nickel incorporation protein HypB [Rubrivivax gelatinosus]MBK1688719.1 hydrogenase accessory protein HypB [Rubrivivax gelatinosus]TCO98039.1 hydrogenase nickel incorporation protein HypB [Rubrivivax gelatinosus]